MPGEQDNDRKTVEMDFQHHISHYYRLRLILILH